MAESARPAWDETGCCRQRAGQATTRGSRHRARGFNKGFKNGFSRVCLGKSLYKSIYYPVDKSGRLPANTCQPTCKHVPTYPLTRTVVLDDSSVSLGPNELQRIAGGDFPAGDDTRLLQFRHRFPDLLPELP